MATASTTTPPLGWKAEDFDLEGTDGKRHCLADLRGPKGTLVMFICNHCPYVQAVPTNHRGCARAAGDGHRHGRDHAQRHGRLPGDSFANMKGLRAAQFPFPYLLDRRKR